MKTIITPMDYIHAMIGKNEDNLYTVISCITGLNMILLSLDMFFEGLY